MQERDIMNQTAVLSFGHTRTAQQVTLFRLFWLFVLASLLGDLAETVFWLITRGELISRSSLIYGPFSLVWGLGAVLLTLVLHPLTGRNNLILFTAGTLLGGAYEYLCSWFQEWAFGVCFWDYSHLPFNLNGRVNLVFCLFWGVAAVIWIRLLLPVLCRFIDRIPRDHARRLTAALAVFLVFSTVISAAALVRMDQRRAGVPASGPAAIYLDEHYPDQRLRDRYPNMGLLPPD